MDNAHIVKPKPEELHPSQYKTKHVVDNDIPKYYIINTVYTAKILT